MVGLPRETYIGAALGKRREGKPPPAWFTSKGGIVGGAADRYFAGLLDQPDDADCERHSVADDDVSGDGPLVGG